MSVPRRSLFEVAIGAVSVALVLAVIFVQGPSVVIAITGIAAVFVPLEWLFGFEHGRLKRSQLVTDLMHAIVSIGIGTFILQCFVLVAAGPMKDVSPLDVERSLPSAAAALLAFALSSFAMYWSHRLEHSVSWLWKMHAG